MAICVSFSIFLLIIPCCGIDESAPLHTVVLLQPLAVFCYLTTSVPSDAGTEPTSCRSIEQPFVQHEKGRIQHKGKTSGNSRKVASGILCFQSIC